MTLDESLTCVAHLDACGTQATLWELAEGLAQRYPAEVLWRRLRGMTDPYPRRLLVFALYEQPSSATVATRMRGLDNDTDEEVAYYALNYRVKRCEPDALAKMTSPRSRYDAPCEQWATTFAQVGACRYEPGAPFLVGGLRHACLNVVRASEGALLSIYPDAPKAQLATPEQVAAYFLARMKRRH
ncbi:hypothetical protein FGE12_12470 [Aggregicoccus sp. 17bor-14]|uniref:hypothetical protein n=1 Tax=Myxococcaceae TaxID=31 RepID=UPI00129CACF6|nr:MULTISPECIES: hypothetical protein [Myxococcaceae]MBF5043205.1 hypothetical protein [Simulacricoccus sp. 17bor-14]MRI88962.1 hypothetical protein [Aggregicoccus sp. 17bor-14]